MNPRFQLTTAAYAFRAFEANNSDKLTNRTVGNGTDQIPVNNSTESTGLNAQFWHSKQWSDINVPVYRCPVITYTQDSGIVVPAAKGVLTTNASDCPTAFFSVRQTGSCLSCPASYPGCDNWGSCTTSSGGIPVQTFYTQYCQCLPPTTPVAYLRP
jgi:hypothetical protein